jgi:hypothetical protein
MRSSLFPAAIAALVICAASASAQSLGDVAKQEELRRAAVAKAAKAAKTYSNAELKTDFTAPPAPVAVEPSAAPSPTNATSAPSADAGATVAPAAPVAKPKEDESAWRWRAGEIRDRVAKAQKRVDGFPGTPNADPREQARTDALLKRAQDELRLAVDAQRLLEMQADVAGVPVAWIK